jgi:pimeloyl-ACP methyl ester carboxylesterase
MTARELESRIAALRGSVRRLLALHGVSWVVGLSLPLLIVSGFADWLFHLDAVIRAVLLAVIVGTVLYLAYRQVVRPLFVRFADLDIAMRIEERWPGLNDRLASTIQFLRIDADDDRHGSSALRDATVRQAIEETSGINFREVIERRPVWKAVGLAAGAMAMAAMVALAAPVSSRIALTRLVLPFGGLQWPQQTHLVLDAANTTLKVARGDTFTLSVKVRPGDKVPEAARATYRFADGAETVEPLRTLEDGEFRGRIESVHQPFRFTVTGGDDTASIRDVAVSVVPPPSLKALTIRLVSPPYTGLPIQTLAPGLTQLRALEGTRLELDAESSKPLTEAQLRIGDGPAGAALAFDASRTRFRAAVPVKGAFAFWFSLKDDDGFRNRDEVRYDVRGFRDEAPRVVIEEPKTDRDVPADATIPVRIMLDDDFGLHSARLIYRVATGESEPHDEAAIPLWSAKDQSPAPAASSVVKHQELAYDWQLAPLKLAVGTVITFHADARDLDSIRAAFAVARLNYFAFSWGTYLGQVYATLFPHRVRRMVLDSTVDPTGVWFTDNVDQDYAFQGRMDAFFAWVARNAGAYHLGRTAAQVQAAYYRARNQLLAHPANGQVGADELDDTFLLGGYDDQLWPGLAQALSSYLNQGSVGGLVGQYQSNGVQDENEFAVYNAVECADTSWPRSFSYWTSDTEQVAKTAPFYAWGNAWFNASCAFWPVQGPNEPLQINGTGLPGILMLQGTLDPATPYAGAQDAHRLLPSARMVVVEGGGNHGQSFAQPPNSCVQGYLNSYLATGALPQRAGLVNATCPAVPDPTAGG